MPLCYGVYHVLLAEKIGRVRVKGVLSFVERSVSITCACHAFS